MDDSFTDLELELRKLRPANPSSRAVSELSRRMQPSPVRSTRYLGWLALPVAAAIAVFVVSLQRTDPTRDDRSLTSAKSVATAAAFQVVGSESVLLNAQDEGVTTLPDGTPARRLRETYLATVVWKDPRSEASLKWTIPREEFRIIPVSVQ